MEKCQPDLIPSESGDILSMPTELKKDMEVSSLPSGGRSVLRGGNVRVIPFEKQRVEIKDFPFAFKCMKCRRTKDGISAELSNGRKFCWKCCDDPVIENRFTSYVKDMNFIGDQYESQKNRRRSSRGCLQNSSVSRG